MDQTVRKNFFIPFYLFWAAFLVLTNKWLGWNEAIEYVTAYDINLYQKITTAAPSFPIEMIHSHIAQRFFPHYFVGVVSKALEIPYPRIYFILFIVLATFQIWATHRALLAYKLSQTSFFVCMSALLASPYVLRYYAVVPGMVQDVLFNLGMAILLMGLTRHERIWLFIGTCTAALGRQTGLTILPGVAIWLVFGSQWKDAKPFQKTLNLGLCFVPLVLIYVMTGTIVSSFTRKTIHVGLLLGLFQCMQSDQYRFTDILEFIFRCVIPFVLPLSLIVAVKKIPKKSVEFWASLLCALGIAAQPLLTGPTMVGKNAARLSALGLIFLINALAITLKDSDLNRKPQSFATMSVLGALFLAVSLHHLYAVFGPRSAAEFAAFHLGLTALLFAVLRYSTKNSMSSLGNT